MPKVEGVYRASNGSWYFKATIGRDPLTGKRIQITKRGFPTATDAARARRELLEAADSGALPAGSSGWMARTGTRDRQYAIDAVFG